MNLLSTLKKNIFYGAEILVGALPEADITYQIQHDH